MDLGATALEGSPKYLFFSVPYEERVMMLQERFPSLCSILHDGKQIRIGLHRFGADFQEDFIPHLLLVAVASNFSAERESSSGMDCAPPVKPSGLWKAVLSGSAGDVNLLLQL